MAEQVSVTTSINAPAAAVWSLVADLPRMGEFSPENDGATWLKGATSATVGARFKGVNSNGKKSWATAGEIIEAVPDKALAFRITAHGLKVAVWRYDITETSGGCEVTETWIDERNGLVKALGKPVSGVADRSAHNRAGMEATLVALKAAAEAGA